ncbi:O-antigen ligase family protein [Algoriphagus limi]|uniref:O-antigen ligase-related domain-containing protein n=1 Tax=Algoriphagus limi TaxID=2975273 RepID=A0ABT2G3Z0_9BACT|nr:O-antigen ligase family protein [Algoriphagus limi]MCS5489186.1 hypothetical protein [Algoriphagus limi]
MQGLLSPKNLFPKSNFQGGNALLGAVWFLIVFTVFSGAIRKWVVGPGTLGNLIFFFQLILPFVFYGIVSRNHLSSRFKTPFIFWLYIGYLIVTAFNPMNHTTFHGFFGILLHLGYWLVWLGYLQKRQWMELEKFVPLLVLILLIEFSISTLQYSLPGTHFLNQFASGEDNTASVGDAVRISGTFSYIGGMQAMIPFFAFLGWYLLLLRKQNFLLLLVFGLGLLLAFMSGSRGAVGFYILISLFAFLSVNNLNTNLKLAGLAIRSFFIIFVLFSLNNSLQDTVIKMYENFMVRVNSTTDLGDRIFFSYIDIWDFRGNYPLFGVGLGSTYQGANALFGESRYVQEYGYYESELARIVLEGGYILFILRLILLFVFLRRTFLPISVKFLFFIFFINSMIVFSAYQGVFFILQIMFLDRAYYIRSSQNLINVKYVKS